MRNIDPEGPPMSKARKEKRLVPVALRVGGNLTAIRSGST
jgi:hypothetical protein